MLGQFHSLYYRPDNAYLIVVGDFDQKQLDAWTDKYLGTIAKPEDYDPDELPKSNRSERKTRGSMTPRLRMFRSRPSRSPIWARDQTMRIFRLYESPTTILSGGESSRLYQALVYKQQIAQEALVQSG